jgi:hypothetical protein
MTYFYVIWPPTQPNPPPHPSIPNHLFAFLLRKKAVDGKNCVVLDIKTSLECIKKLIIWQL